MWKCLLLCVCVALWRDAHGHFTAMTEIVQRCCDDVSGYAWNHTELECSSSRPVPDDVSPSYKSLCIMVRAQCCKEYYQKKNDCNTGIEIATTTKQCGAAKESALMCCNECTRGTSIGRDRGSSACVRPHADSTEDLLSYDAFVKCCLNVAKEEPSKTIPVSTGRKEKRENTATVASLCEDYAPTELCAHHCIPVPGSYKCECNPGFMLMPDGRNCKEVVKNRCRPHNHCQHKCNDNGVEVKCSCRRGYELMPDGKSCQDIDECQLDVSICSPGMQCSNIPGSYRCVQEKKNKPEKGHCPPGFTRNLRNQACDDINECQLPNPPCPAYLCENTVGGYKCDGVAGDPLKLNSNSKQVEDRCPPGFALGNHGECEDVDECANHKDDCNPLSQFCINTHSSFFCQDMVSKMCRPGFKVNPSSGKCEDINECEEDDELCKPDNICVNQLGQYDCKPIPDNTRLRRQRCPDGMKMDPITQRCEDINECLDGTHLCDRHQNCLNTNGSFECHCQLGYELDITTGTCADVNECATGQHSCIIGSQRCDNTVGSFLCIRIASCGTGYILQHATGNCEDIDECALGIAKCYRAGPDYQCMNIPGSFRCIKKRVSTTTTTTENSIYYYDYVYEDSDEETDGNQTAKVNPAPPPAPVDIPYTDPSSSAPPPSPTLISTADSPPPTSSTTEPLQTTPKEEPRIEDNSVYPETDRDATKIELSPSAEVSPTPNQFSPVNQREPRPETPVDQGRTYYHLGDPEPPIPSATPIPRTRPYPKPEARPDSPIQPEIIYKDPERPEHTPISTYYETRSEIPERPISNEIIPTEKQNELDKPAEVEPTLVLETEPSIVRLDPKVESTYSPYKPTNPPQVTPPYAVDVNVGEETATVTGERNEDGSVVLDTKNIPKNTWTAVEVKPIPCPAGFEPNDNGGCFDVDECTTNQHSCSGLTESCRNTIGGYLCICAAGFRRDSITGACDVIPVLPNVRVPQILRPKPLPPFVSSTSTSTSTTTEPPPPPPSTTTEPPPPPPRTTTEPPPPPPSTTTEPPLPPPSSTTTEPPPPPPPSTTPVPIPTTPKIRSFWGYQDHRYAATRPFYPRFSCDSGFHKNPRTGECEDIDECTNGQANCAVLEICENTQGGYKCECPPNWRLDNVRHRCMPVVSDGIFPPGYGNEPVYPQSVQEPESEESGSNYLFPKVTDSDDQVNVPRCRFGYQLGDNDICEDIDECATGKSRCSPGKICTNLPGGYVCSCPPGHRQMEDDRCEDVDECAMAGNMSICSPNADCVNTVGSYQCRCHNGFRAAPVNEKVCVDVDECSESRPGSLCQHRCSNVWGSYRCFCHRGYRLNSDNRTCSDVDECVQFKSKIPCIGKCINKPGSYRCACPPGYRLSTDSRSCIDIDECEIGEATCQSGILGGTSHVCFNTRGSYRCQRITCPPGYRLESKHRCSKTERVCEAGDWECAHQPTTISYNFITFVSNLYVPESKVKLFTMRGPTWQQAKMKFELKLLNVNAPPSVRDKADIGAFLLIQNDNEGVMSLVRPLEGPQSIELELSMELYSRDQFGGTAIAKLFIFVSEYEF